MFDRLSDRLNGILGKLRGKGALREEDVDNAMREIRVALLEADVALPVVKEFVETVRAQAIGQEIIKGVNAAQQVVKIVHDAMIDMLGGGTQDLAFAAPPSVYLMVGLQGSGKTTTTAKIAKHLTDKQRKKILMASLDVYRPAAQEQLRQLGTQTGVATLEIIKDQKPLDITTRALDEARKGGFDVVILDTAGRTTIDEDMMAEVEAIRKAANPVETLLVADAMTGQDAVNTAKAFADRVGLTGIVLTRVDGDARGGAAMSMKAVTGVPVKLIGVGEKWDALEQFHPDRIAGRILGMGDVVSLVEKAIETVDKAEMETLSKKFKKGQFDFEDMLTQLRQMQKMGGVGGIMKMLPGLGKIAGQLENANIDDGAIKRQEAIILSMTKKERAEPKLLNASRRRRIAAGSGVTVQDVNKIVKQQEQMQLVMKRMKKMGLGNMMGMMKNLVGEHETDMLMKSMDADALGADMEALEAMQGQREVLGSNPFLGKGGMGGMPSGFGGGMGGMGGLPRFPMHGGKKKRK